MRNWGTGRCREEEKKRPNARKTIWLHRLMDASWALSLTSLSAFLFLSLSPSLPSLRLFLQTRWQHQSKQKSRSVMWCVCAQTHTHTHTHTQTPVGTYRDTATSSPQKRFIRFEQQRLVLMCGAVMMICFPRSLFFMADTGREWCWWRPPCCFHSSLNQTQSVNKMNHVFLYLEQAEVRKAGPFAAPNFSLDEDFPLITCFETGKCPKSS